MEALESDNSSFLLQIRKDRGSSKNFLTTPSQDVIKICACAERIIRNKPNILKMHNAITRLSCRIKLHLPANLFNSLETGMFLLDVESNHKSNLINQIIKTFLKLRIYHESKSLKDKIVQFRSYCNRLVIFKNQ